MTYAFRPLHDKTWLKPKTRQRTRFSASWSDTLDLLYTEVAALDGKDLVLEVDIHETDLRLDGTIRARARAASPAVIVSFSTPAGALMFRCDRYTAAHYGQPDDWQQNVRAIALTLQALRAVDRYGATSSGEQYAGWRQLATTPAAHPDPWQTLTALAGADVANDRASIIRRARRNAHPDNGGSHELWLQFTAAYDALEAEAHRA